MVLGAWCLVLGAWCLVLGAWCLVLGAEIVRIQSTPTYLDKDASF
jgi:hypothetical protein